MWSAYCVIGRHFRRYTMEPFQVPWHKTYKIKMSANKNLYKKKHLKSKWLQNKNGCKQKHLKYKRLRNQIICTDTRNNKALISQNGSSLKH